MKTLERGDKKIAVYITIFFLLFFVGFQSSSIYGGDAGDLVTAAYVRGVAHPPGYPLYTFIGWLLTKIPYSTVAWRVTLLSSIPSALTLGLFYLIAAKISKSKYAALISTFALGFSYLFWLYASVPEVFAMHNLFVVGLLYILVRLNEEKVWLPYFYTAVFVLGLSLSHHHFILFLLPTFFMLGYPKVKEIAITAALLFRTALSFLVGLIPYVYVVWAASSSPPINWENPVTVSGFINLVSRSLYGSFRSNQGLGMVPLERYAALQVALDTLFLDFTSVGLALFCIGLYVLWRKSHSYFLALLVGFFLTGPFFVYYASFPIAHNFGVATAERFLLTPYIFIFIFIASGISAIVHTLTRLFTGKRAFIGQGLMYVFILFPALFLYFNYYKITPLKHDRTAEKLAADLLQSAPDNALLILTEDTAIFNTQYVYFSTGGQSAWRGIKILMGGMVSTDFYQKAILDTYPELHLKELKQSDSTGLFENIADFYGSQYPIVSTSLVPMSRKYGWIPYGLLFHLYEIEKLEMPTPQEYEKKTEALFTQYQNIHDSSLHVYTNLMLADVLNFYSVAHHNAGKVYMNLEMYDVAGGHFNQSFEYNSRNLDNLLMLGEVQSKQGLCNEAEETTLQYMQKMPSNQNAFTLLAKVYRDCFRDEVKAEEVEKQYTETLKLF